mmetsp:Transcript_101529/g.262430  ORF Transcript_101529/g.262430 Transcript_101529/m.262430 type:complete len:363 (-) Transcript_101529:111-1199(-)
MARPGCGMAAADRIRPAASRAAGTVLVLAAVACQLLPHALAQDLSQVCEHENYDNVGPSVEVMDGETVYRQIRPNQTHRFFYRSFNVTTMNQPDAYRKLIINLEPCRGVVYLFVRKTRRCYPNPYSCIKLTPGEELRNPADCAWTHFMSEIDRSRDGTPTFFELPLSSTKYFISVFATENSEYTLTVLSDIGAFPRPGNSGKIAARQLRELQVQLTWDVASFFPTGISDTKQYWVYSSMLLDSDNRTNMAVFMRPDKILNTVCGLANNTDRQYALIPASSCQGGQCNATIDGVITDKRYVFNIVAESHRGFRMAYAGLIMRTDWEVIRQAASDQTLKVIGAVSGSVIGMVVIIYFLMLKLYG